MSTLGIKKKRVTNADLSTKKPLVYKFDTTTLSMLAKHLDLEPADL
jgi:hypothetical protein